MRALITASLLLFTTLAQAEESRFTLSLKDGRDLPKFLQKNSWVNDLQKTNLYEGLVLRMAPLMGALPSDHQKTWKGRISDTFIELALNNRPVHIDYYHARSLVQPLAISVQGLSEIEIKALTPIISSLRTTEDQKIDINNKKISVTPISVANQKLAIKISGTCLSMSRDPKVAIWSWQQCQASKPVVADAQLKINLATLTGGTSKAIENYLGIKKVAHVQFTKSEEGVFSISSASVPLTKNHILKNIQFSEAQLGAIPATANFVVRMAIPMPKTISAETVSTFLAEDVAGWKKAKHVVASYVHLKSTKIKDGGVVAETGLLIDKVNKDFSEAAWVQIFEARYGKEIFVKDVCGKKMTLITQYDSVLKSVESACSNKVPTLQQIPAELKGLLAMGTGTQAVLFNVGQTFSQMIDLGWSIDRPDKEIPAEVQEAKKILARLPALVLGGKVDKESIAYDAKQGVF